MHFCDEFFNFMIFERGSKPLCSSTLKSFTVAFSKFPKRSICVLLCLISRDVLWGTQIKLYHAVKALGPFILQPLFQEVVLEKWFFKLGFFFLVNDFSQTRKNVGLWYETTFFSGQPLFSNQISQTRFHKPDFSNQISKNCKNRGRRIKG